MMMSRNNEMRRSMLAELLEGQPTTKKQRTIPTAPVSTLMIDGSRAYEEKRYHDAITFFSHAIENLRDRKADLLHVYDLRSSACTKLGKHDEALKDAKQMVRLDKIDYRGYLRCAQIEQLRGEHKGALRVCEYGLKSVPPNSKGYPRLERCKLRLTELLKEKVIYEKGTDPMLVLPNELLEMILSTFDYQQHIGIMRVCKTWRERVRSSDLVAKTIDTRNSRKFLSYEQTKAAFARLGEEPKFVALGSLGETAARWTSSELARWIRWESLETLILDEPKIHTLHIRWNKMPRLQNLRIGYCPDTRQDLLQVLGVCASLQSASLHVHPIIPLFSDLSVANRNLRTLVVHGKPDKVTLVELRSGCLFPLLERLELINVSSNRDVNLAEYSELKHLSLRNCHFRENLRTPASLESFTLCGNFANTYPRPEEIKMPAGNLHTVNVQGTESIKFLTYARRQGLSNQKLRNVTIADFVTFSNFAGRFLRNDLEMLHTYAGTGVFDRVQHLGLQDDNIVDQDYLILHRLFSVVEHLDIEAPQITDAFVSDLQRSPDSRIKTVTLRNCTNVSLEIVDWSRARDVKVNIVRQSVRPKTNNGRRVRYDG